MRDTELYQQIVGLSSEWQVTGVTLDLEAETVEIAATRSGDPLRCTV